MSAPRWDPSMGMGEMDAPPPPVAREPNPTPARVMEWMAHVPDPEIPAISLADLGVIRDVAWEGGTLVVTVTPTYSGCPATSVISLAISDAIARRGVARHRIDTRLSPPWTTDWISAEGRDKLRAYGISPPSPAGPEACPRCGSAATRKVSQFGSTPCKAQWRCLDCLEPFDHFKCI